MKLHLGTVLIAAALSTSSVRAATLTIHAASVTSGLTDFEITFNDTGDGLLQLAEITSFTGFTYTGGSSADGFYSAVSQVADISGVAAGGGGFLWGFKKNPGDVGSLAAGATRWTYGFVTPPGGDGEVSAVPEPSTWTLMILAFAGLASATRRRAARA